MVLDNLRKIFSSGNDFSGDEYIEIDLGHEKKEKKVLVKLFNLRQYDDINNILNALREGYTIAIVDMKTLRQKDPVELKRAISKIKKTIDALEGNIAGFGEHTIIATPSFAMIHKEDMIPKDKEKANKFDF
ncbi:cell division protein SepF [Candidatus Pacearchaeota archaeon]|nr:cell division protein SepF [Candidatus Pacearchaeota archaeon]